MTTPLWHATVSGVLSGLAFPIGDDTFFTAWDDPAIYQVTHLSILTLIPVEGSQVERLTRTVIEPRLRAQTGRAA